jgi:Flp pilus assembly protein TadD
MDSGPEQMGAAAPSHGATGEAPSPQQLFEAALAHHRQGRMAKAEELYRQILAGDPNHVDSLHMLGVLALQAARADAAVDLIGRAIALRGDNASSHNNIGEAYRHLGRFDEAIAHFTKAIELDPGAPEGPMSLGNILRQQGRLDEAIDLYRHALELRPGYAEAHLNLGVALMEQGNSEDAVGQLRQALSLNPNFPEALMNLGIVLQNRGDLEGATAHYRRALALRPNYAVAHFNFGNALLEQGHLEEAVARYQQAMAFMGPGAPPTGALSPIDSIRRAMPEGRALSAAQEQCFMNLVRANCWRSAERQWRVLCGAALEQAGLTQVSGLELLARIAISQWIERDRVGLADTLQVAAEVSTAIGPTPSKDVRNSRAYATFLTNLLQQANAAPAPDPALPLLAVVGDSHCLAFHDVTVTLDGVTYRTGGRLVMGGKAWHLANGQPNLYKWRLGAILDAIPERSPIVCCFGEIDCRLDEGILPYYRRTGGDLEQLISDQVGRYVAHVVAAAAPRRLSPLFVGVPAPHFDTLSPEHPDASADNKALLIDIVKVFNIYLRRAAAKHGGRMIDVFAISAGPDGKASGEQHIDDYHLKPAALDLALRQ